MDVPKNNGLITQFIGSVPVSVWMFLIVQLMTIVVWGVKLEGRVSAVELHSKQIEILHTEYVKAAAAQIERMDERGTRGLAVLQVRADQIWARLERMEDRIARIADFLVKGSGDGRGNDGR